MKATAIFLTGLMALGLTQPVLAQGGTYKPTGTRIGRPAPAQVPDNTSLSQIDAARRTVNEFTDCIVKKDRKRTERYLAAAAQSAASQALAHELVTSDCLWDGQLSMPDELLRGAIFRSVYQRDFASRPLQFGEQPIDFSIYVEDPKSATSIRYLILLDFADCVVRADGASARSFALATPGSPTEKTTLATLQPQLGPCLSSGMNVTFNKSILAAVLSEALYREVEAGQKPTAEASR